MLSLTLTARPANPAAPFAPPWPPTVSALSASTELAPGLVAALEVIGSELLLAEEEGQVVAEVAEAGGSAKL